MRIIHTPKLRAESKHVAEKRQLLAQACAWMLCAPYLYADSPAPAGNPARDELRAAQLMETTLLARQAGKEELKKLERVFADLETRYPRDVAVKNGHAEFLWTIGEREQAVEKWLAAERVDPSNAVVLEHLAGSAFAAGEVKKAAGYYARAVKSAPENAAYHFSYANLTFLFRHDLHDAAHPESEDVLNDALMHFAEAARLEPLNAEYTRAFAETFYALENPDWQEALKAWQHLCEISPDKDFALLNMARVHMKLGDKAAARASLEQVQNPKYGRLKERLTERMRQE